MSTTQRDKPTAKARQRNRKDQRNQKSERQASVRPDRDDESAPIVAPADAAPVAMVAMEEAGGVAMEQVTEVATEEAMEEDTEVALSGEVLPPDVSGDTAPPSNAVGLTTVVQAYGDYTRKSWQASRFLVERLMTARSFDEAIEIEGEFAKQAYANFFAQSQKICGLYGEMAKQLFQPFDKFAIQWTRR